MRALLIVCLMLITGCKTVPGGIVVSGSAYVEADRPEGRAVAKLEVQYRPPVEPPHHEDLSRTVSLGQPVGVSH